MTPGSLVATVGSLSPSAADEPARAGSIAAQRLSSIDHRCTPPAAGTSTGESGA